VATPRGEKTELIRRAVAGKTQPFRIAELHGDCPGVSTDMIRHVLKNLRAEGKVECLGRGQSARWRKTAK
jgi:DNA-binding HxlR family transcriptional regulator